MGLRDRFLNSKLSPTVAEKVEDQAILVYINSENLEGSIPVQEKLFELLENEDLGMFDGNEVGGGQLILFLYGPDAELLFKHIEPTLRADAFCHGAKVIIRWGGPGAPQREVIL